MSDDTEEIISAREKISKCKSLSDKEEKITCMYEALHNVTKAQDIINLTIREVIDNSEDLRWIPIHIVDDANAVILGISERKGNPKSIVQRGGYVDEKMDSIRDKWNMLKWKHGT